MLINQKMVRIHLRMLDWFLDFPLFFGQTDLEGNFFRSRQNPEWGHFLSFYRIRIPFTTSGTKILQKVNNLSVSSCTNKLSKDKVFWKAIFYKQVPLDFFSQGMTTIQYGDMWHKAGHCDSNYFPLAPKNVWNFAKYYGLSKNRKWLNKKAFLLYFPLKKPK